MTIHSFIFCGHEVSEEGKKNMRVDYGTLAKAFNAVLCNNITEFGTLTYESGGCDDGYYHEIFQWYIISYGGAELLMDCTNELVYYHEELEVYVWGVTHFGTSWDYVLTDIEIELA